MHVGVCSVRKQAAACLLLTCCGLPGMQPLEGQQRNTPPVRRACTHTRGTQVLPAHHSRALLSGFRVAGSHVNAPLHVPVVLWHGSVGVALHATGPHMTATPGVGAGPSSRTQPACSVGMRV